MKTQNRNERCLCGSGLKYKNCCGKNGGYYNTGENPILNIPSKAVLFRGSPATSKVPTDLSEIISISFHFKGDMFDKGKGINLPIHKGQLGHQPADIIKMCESAHVGFMREYHKKGMSFVFDIVKQLEEFIEATVGIEESDLIGISDEEKEQIMKIQSCILMDIWSLTVIGYIKDDEYNGVNWNRLHVR